MSEMDELKRNTEVEYAKQRMEEVGQYLTMLADKIGDALYWALRSDLLFMFSFIGYFAILGVGLWMETPEEVLDIALELVHLIILVTIFRSWIKYRDLVYYDSELRGAFNILRKLGMLKEDSMGDGQKKRAREPMFARIKTMLEKTFERESKEAMQPV